MRAEPGIYTARPGNSHSTQAGGTKYKEILLKTILNMKPLHLFLGLIDNQVFKFFDNF